MNLRNKLLLSFLIFIAALVALGAWSALSLRELGGVSRRIISQNYDSVVATQDMKESLERMDSAALFLLLGNSDRAMAQFKEHRARFDAAFSKAAGNITEQGEPEIIEAIRSGRDEYYRRFEAFVAGGEKRRSEDYFQRLEPIFNKTRAECDRLLQLNQGAMAAKSDAAAAVARRELLFTLALAGAMVVAGLALAVLLANGIMRPVRELTATAGRIAGGDLAAKARATSRDEVGILAAEFNRMAERVQQLRRSDLGRLVAAQQTTVALLEDITRLREIDRFKSEFVSTAARYLQAPLLNLQTGLHCLITDAAGEINDQQKDILYACREDGERLERLMRDLTDLSRIESGEAAPRLAPVRIEDVIQSAVESFRLEAEARDQSLKTDIAPALPPLDADAEQIKRVLDNLLSNAIRNTPRGGEIRITAARREDYLSVSVADTGRGIPPDYLPRLFDRFLSMPGAKPGGTGLGLAISKRLIEAHGGQISAQSRVGLGATITFTLPVTREGP